ncbi:hypothetical protein V8G54_009284 [Vigna mungo]|uniref:Uncharacterized protein n=1 Tax=Vigna mungo TaxID=3915 RepID=A0AAQ3NWF9_VIGMU
MGFTLCCAELYFSTPFISLSEIIGLIRNLVFFFFNLFGFSHFLQIQHSAVTSVTTSAVRSATTSAAALTRTMRFRRQSSGSSCRWSCSERQEKTRAYACSVCLSSPRRRRSGACRTVSTFFIAPVWTVGSIAVTKLVLFVGLPLYSILLVKI